jgi:hypothetical protein
MYISRQLFFLVFQLRLDLLVNMTRDLRWFKRFLISMMSHCRQPQLLLAFSPRRRAVLFRQIKVFLHDCPSITIGSKTRQDFNRHDLKVSMCIYNWHTQNPPKSIGLIHDKTSLQNIILCRPTY